jgi:putative PIG3 family NAD(P)H quinone oxidoreductase
LLALPPLAGTPWYLLSNLSERSAGFLLEQAMRAVVIEGRAGTSSLLVHEVPTPQPRGEQVLVKVHAAGLNRADLLQARGAYPPPPGAPANIPGLEFAGEVVARGPDCAGPLQPADRVFGIVGGGGLAEYVVTHERLAVPIPQPLDWTAAGAVPEAFITAHDALTTQGALEPGQSVLIHTAGGGVGLAAVQVAHVMGCQVFGTARTAEKLQRAIPYGLDRGIDLAEEGGRFDKIIARQTEGRGVDVVIDFLGGPYWERNVASLAPTGRLVIVGLLAGAQAQVDLRALMSNRLRVVATVLRSRPLEDKIAATRAFAGSVVPWLALGRIHPVVDAVFPLAQIQEAAAYMESNRAFGKIVLKPGD